MKGLLRQYYPKGKDLSAVSHTFTGKRRRISLAQDDTYQPERLP